MTMPPPPLPPGWMQVTDPVSKRVYYANMTTGETRWDAPPPPPPPPPSLPHHHHHHHLHHPPQHPQHVSVNVHANVPPPHSFPPQAVAPSPFPPSLHVMNSPPLAVPPSIHQMPQQPQPQPQQAPPPNFSMPPPLPVPVHVPVPPSTAIPTTIPPPIVPMSTVPVPVSTPTPVPAPTPTVILDPAVSGAMLVPTIRAMMDQLQMTPTIHNNNNIPPPVPPSTPELNPNHKNIMELPRLSAGTIADLCNVTRDYKMEQRKLFKAMSKASNINILEQQQQQQQHDKVEEEEEDEEDLFVHYQEPLKPHEMPIGSRPPHIEPGRVDIRIMSLYHQLENLSHDQH